MTTKRKRLIKVEEAGWLPGVGPSPRWLEEKNGGEISYCTKPSSVGGGVEVLHYFYIGNKENMIAIVKDPPHTVTHHGDCPVGSSLPEKECEEIKEKVSGFFRKLRERQRKIDKEKDRRLFEVLNMSRRWDW